jgi:hypothetical protein
MLFPPSEATEATPVWQKGVHALAKLVAATLRSGHCEMWYRTGPIITASAFGLIEVLDSRPSHPPLAQPLAATLCAEVAASGQPVMWFSHNDIATRHSALALGLPMYLLPVAVAGVCIRLPIAISGLDPTAQAEAPVTTVALFAWYEPYELCFTAPATTFLADHSHTLHIACILTAQAAEEARLSSTSSRTPSGLELLATLGGGQRQHQTGIMDTGAASWLYSMTDHMNVGHGGATAYVDSPHGRPLTEAGYAEPAALHVDQRKASHLLDSQRRKLKEVSEATKPSPELSYSQNSQSGRKRARPKDPPAGSRSSADVHTANRLASLWVQDESDPRSVLAARKLPPKAPPVFAKTGRTTSTASALTKEPYGLPVSEHMHMTEAGLPAVSDAALARVKGRSRAPKPKLAVALRRGKWPTEEENFTNVLIDNFRAGLLPIAEGTTLRTYLSGQLHCAPMRITKKYAKDSSIGKQVYHRRSDLPMAVWGQLSTNATQRVMKSRELFFSAVLSRSHVDLSMVCPDPFPTDGIVRDAFGYTDNDPEAHGDLAEADINDDEDAKDGTLTHHVDVSKEQAYKSNRTVTSISGSRLEGEASRSRGRKVTPSVAIHRECNDLEVAEQLSGAVLSIDHSAPGIQPSTEVGHHADFSRSTTVAWPSAHHFGFAPTDAPYGTNG